MLKNVKVYIKTELKNYKLIIKISTISLIYSFFFSAQSVKKKYIYIKHNTLVNHVFRNLCLSDIYLVSASITDTNTKL